jgi:DNA-binding response OmpR family regulator
VWGKDLVVDPRTVDNFVSSLKRKLRWSRKSPFRIATVRGVGYRLEIDE